MEAFVTPLYEEENEILVKIRRMPMTRADVTIAASVVLTASLVFAVLGASELALYNVAPLILASVIRLLARSSVLETVRKTVSLVFSMTATFIVAFFHFVWLTDLNGAATGSSTSPVIFIFIPIYAVIGAILGAALSGIILRRRIAAEATEQSRRGGGR